ncbi:MAG: helix-turn-helix transcriptional regulator [Spirochaetes bacterium]|nr:helix-turn-helix transcriptional regulator [Spirochaetota bacterium]
MQKRPYLAASSQYDPIALAADFPITVPIPHDRRGGQKVQPHVHDCFELGYCARGSGLCVIENKALPYGAGDVVAIPPRELHMVVSSPGVVSHWSFTNLDPSALLAGFAPVEERYLETAAMTGPGFHNVFSAAEHPFLAASVGALMEELLSKSPGRSSAVRALTWLILVRIHQARRLRPPSGGKGSGRRELGKIRPALEYIAEHYHEAISIRRLADHCGLSATHFRREFAAAVGGAPLSYLIQFRLRAAGVLLKNSARPIVEIAGATGFETLSSFNRHFKACYGMSPRAWRREA